MNEHEQAYHRAFSISVSEVMSTMTGFEMEEDASFSESRGDSCDASNKEPCEISGAMVLFGGKNGMATATMTRTTASVLVSYMTGIPYYELSDEDLFDGVAEMMNLIAGRAKALLRDTEFYFEISPPFTIVGKNHYIVHKKQASLIQKRFTSNDISFILKVFNT
ncbi:chemotaxis protein CheX [Tindallia californiensis]|uniref:Chemotaxis protein CheX n=1 Tax=Tindallia californiensis TaxID=159292 RepID=A0A1H3I4P3_9FIRM|nr:chemotaxis protein CheX [Tindallia californiensis]SDY22631.1 chemotaxis protein CheX [Tindallia californiensis]